MDIVDRAQDLEERTRQQALDRTLSSVYSARESAKNCCECDAMIPSARQIAVPGCQLCVICAEIFEQRAAGYRRAA